MFVSVLMFMFVFMVMVVIMAAAALAMRVTVVMMRRMYVGLVPIPGGDGHTRLDCRGKLQNLRNQGIRILCGDPKLPGSKGDGRLLHLRKLIDPRFDFGSAVGAVQIVDNVNGLFHLSLPIS